MKSKKNTQFLIFQTIGIVLVVLGHKGGIELFTDWFPIYTFHMPLFIFISGYFFKISSCNNLINFIKVKFKRLVIPYFLWNLFYGITITVLTKMSIIDYSGHGAELLSMKTLFIRPWLDGHQYIFNLPAWFVLSLFLVQVTYASFRKVIKHINLDMEYILMILFIIVGVISVGKANEGYAIGYKIPIVRTIFLLQFFHLGYLYKEKLEAKDKLGNIPYFAIIFIIQFIIIKNYSSRGFSVALLENFNEENFLVPFLTSLTGIFFWLRISRILVKPFEGNKVLEYIGSNTWDIMIHHIFVFFLVNAVLYKIAPYFNLDFNYELFRTNVWYTFNPINSVNFNLFYSFAGISIPLLTRYYISKMRTLMNSKFIKP